MTKASLDARMQRYTVWTAAVSLAAPSPSLSRSGARSPPGFPPRQAAGRYRITTMAALSDESEDQGPGYSDSLRSDLPVSLPAAVVHLSSADMTLLVSLSALSPVPCLGGWVLISSSGLLLFVTRLSWNCSRWMLFLIPFSLISWVRILRTCRQRNWLLSNGVKLFPLVVLEC
jgi:hypothetical protein